MATREIWHEILFNASASEVYEAATDTKKLAHWWTTDTRGESQIGKKLEFWFGGMCQPMEVTVLKPGDLWAGMRRKVAHQDGLTHKSNSRFFAIRKGSGDLAKLTQVSSDTPFSSRPRAKVSRSLWLCPSAIPAALKTSASSSATPTLRLESSSVLTRRSTVGFYAEPTAAPR
jgi:hypothetical protein